MSTQLSQLQEHYWSDRYALKDENGDNIEKTIDETWRRVADSIARDVWEADSFFDLLSDFHFVPGGRILAGAGAESDKTFYNCYVIPVETAARRHNRANPSFLKVTGPYATERNMGELRDYLKNHIHEWKNSPIIVGNADVEVTALPREDAGSDSREAIFDTIGTMVGIMSRGGGVGINWSVLRPRDAYLTRVSGHSSGPVGWMDVASTAVGEVIQGGSRRGAAMFMLDVWHPDVLQFINAKKDNSKITNANISVGITNNFMEALRNDEDWTFIFPDTTHPLYNEVWDGDINAWVERGLPVREFGTVPASSIWQSISEAAWESGEPGVIFIDRYNEESTANGQERIICVNPCGEQGLGAYSVCNLGAMNLYAYAERDSEYGFSVFKWDKFYRDVRLAIRFLDAVIDKTPNYLAETSERQEQLRRIGLGVMGLADVLVALGIRYGSPESVVFTQNVFMKMKDAAIEESQHLAVEFGPAKGWRPEMVDRPYLKEYTERTGKSVGPMRNLFLLTQAPTGTTSLLAGVNSGIEPYFNLATWRQDRTGGRWVMAAAVRDLWGEPVEGAETPWRDVDYVVTSKEVEVHEHIAIQAAVQRFVDSSVSKTVNAPSTQTKEQTARVFNLAYKMGLKGIAYYRDGSRNQQVLYHEKPQDRIAELEGKIAELESKLRFRERVTMMTTPIEGTVPPSAGSKCPECEDGYIVYEEGCQKCYSCGWSAC